MRTCLLLCLAFLFPAQYDSKTAPAQSNGDTSSSQTPQYTAAYTNEFYLALRDALHAEVNSWRGDVESSPRSVTELWG